MFEVFQLSNDAFYYLRDGEEPLLDEAMDEALAIEALYPDGFAILDFRPLGDTGYVEARIGPKTAPAPAPALVPAPVATPKHLCYDEEAVRRNTLKFYDADETQTLSKVCRLDITWLDAGRARLRAYWFRLDTGRRTELGEFPAQSTPKGLKYFQITRSDGTFSRFYLKHFVKV